MREATFISEIMGSIGKAGFWAYKLADSPTSWTKDKTRFTPAKPCDIVSCFFGLMVAIECKQLRKWKAFSLSDMRESQIEALDAILVTHGLSFVFLNVRVEADFVKGTKRENRLIVFPWADLKARFASGSIKAKELQTLPYVTGTKKRFDLSQFIGNLTAEPTTSDF